MRQEMMGFGDAVASAAPYAISLHLAPDITTPTPQFLPAALPDTQPTAVECCW